MNADGSNAINISNNAYTEAHPSWHPDGSRIVFKSNRAGGAIQEVFVMNSDGTNIEQVTNGSGASCNYPVFSPDGTTIVYHQTVSGFGVELFSININGTELQRLTFSTGNDQNASFSPNGLRILFVSNRSGTYELYLMDTNGANQSPIPGTAASNTSGPAFSPDGAKAVFRSNVTGLSQIHTINIDGTELEQLTNTQQISSLMSQDWQPLTIAPSIIDSSITLDATKGSVTYNAPSNHTDTYESVDPTSVTITTQPQKGTVVVNQTTGEITYTPNKQANLGFNLLASFDSLLFKPASAQSAIQDSFTYSICSTANSQLCTTSTVTVNLASASSSLANTGTNLLPLTAASFITIIGSGLYLIHRRRISRH